MKTTQQTNVELLRKLIQKGTPKQYLLFFKRFHEADIAETLSKLSQSEQEQFFKTLNPEIAAEVLEELDIEKQKDIISKFKIDTAAKYIEEMEPDDAVDLLEEISETNEIQAQQIFNALPKKEQSELKTLLSYEEGSAGSIMTSTVITIPENLTIDEALSHIKKTNPPESEISFYIFITSDANTLVGYTTLRDLVFSDGHKKVFNLRHEHNIYVNHHEDQETVATIFQKYDMAVLPVVNEQNQLLGAITVDDVVDVVIEEATEDIYKLTGTALEAKDTLLTFKIIRPIISRIPWLILTILGGIIASTLITNYSLKFESNLFPLALSLSFIPLLIGLSGNVGNQSSAIIVRGIALGQVKARSAFKIILHECIVSTTIGILIGTLLFVISYLVLGYSYLFSSIITLALFLNIVVAAIIGTILPLLFNKINIDPAIASAPFISTALDIIGQIIYFSLTLYMLQLAL